MVFNCALFVSVCMCGWIDGLLMFHVKHTLRRTDLFFASFLCLQCGLQPRTTALWWQNAARCPSYQSTLNTLPHATRWNIHTRTHSFIHHPTVQIITGGMHILTYVCFVDFSFFTCRKKKKRKLRRKNLWAKRKSRAWWCCRQLDGVCVLEAENRCEIDEGCSSAVEEEEDRCNPSVFLSLSPLPPTLCMREKSHMSSRIVSPHLCGSLV